MSIKRSFNNFDKSEPARYRVTILDFNKVRNDWDMAVASTGPYTLLKTDNHASTSVFITQFLKAGCCS